MVISSRTPEGDPNRCPICGHACRIEPSEPSRDGPCPHCGHLLWLGKDSGQAGVAAGEVLVQLVVAKFGPLLPELEHTVRALARGPRRDQILDRVLTASTLEELLVEG